MTKLKKETQNIDQRIKKKEDKEIVEWLFFSFLILF